MRDCNCNENCVGYCESPEGLKKTIAQLKERIEELESDENITAAEFLGEWWSGANIQGIAEMDGDELTELQLTMIPQGDGAVIDKGTIAQLQLSAGVIAAAREVVNMADPVSPQSSHSAVDTCLIGILDVELKTLDSLDTQSNKRRSDD